MSDHKYRIKYDFDVTVGEYSKDEIKKEKKGGSDALILTSILYPKDGSLSTYFESFDGRNEGKPLSDHEIFKTWLMMATRLGESKTLTDFQKEFAKFTAKHYWDSLEKPDPDDAA